MRFFCVYDSPKSLSFISCISLLQEAANLAALQATGGNVSAAVDRVLSQMGGSF